MLSWARSRKHSSYIIAFVSFVLHPASNGQDAQDARPKQAVVRRGNNRHQGDQQTQNGGYNRIGFHGLKIW